MNSPANRRTHRASQPRIVAIGDLNGSLDGLTTILSGTGLLTGRGRWSGGRARLVQVGDIFNRGPNARGCFEFLMRLQAEARSAGGEVTVLLGNHEVMTALGNEIECTVEEYLAFADARSRQAWPRRVRRAWLGRLRAQRDDAIIAPLEPWITRWKFDNVPGKAALRRALGPRGRIGRALRRLPIAARIDDLVFVHAGLTMPWAELGIEGLNAACREAWEVAPTSYRDLSKTSILRATDGPIWCRTFARGVEHDTSKLLGDVLRTLGGRRMVVGHTRTKAMPGGRDGAIHLRHGKRLVGIDVGIGIGGQPAALVVDGDHACEWSADGTRALW